MAMGVLHSVSALVVACSRQVSRMSKKLLGGGGQRSIDRAKIAPSWAPYLSRRVSLFPFRGGNKKETGEERNKRRQEEEEEEEEDYYEDMEESSEEEEEEEGEKKAGVWRRAILMGEKCQPLDFSGVIYYDSEGRRVPELPPRSPLRSPLPSFSVPVVVVSSDNTAGVNH